MVANVAFLAALTTFLAVAWLAGELSFLAPFKAGIFRNQSRRGNHGRLAGAICYRRKARCTFITATITIAIESSSARGARSQLEFC